MTLEPHVNELLSQDWGSHDGMPFWENVDQFCRGCAESDCPVFKLLRGHSAKVRGKLAEVRDACEYVQDYREAAAILSDHRATGTPG